MFNTMSVRGIKAHETYDWLLKKHYAKRIPNIMFAFGLYQGMELVGVVTYGMPASPSLCKGVCGVEYKDKVLELNRVVLKDNEKNLASFFVSKTLKMLPAPRIVVSYADTSKTHVGYIYQATNFLYTGMTVARTDVDTGEAHSRHYQGLDMTKRKDRPQKHRYVYFVGSKTQKRQLRKKLNYDVLPYAKGDVGQYDTSAKFPTQLAFL